MTPHPITQPGTSCRLATIRLFSFFIVVGAILFCSTAPLSASDGQLENDEDAAITSMVKASLLTHLLLTSRTETRNGMVTLRGNAADSAERELGTSLALGVDGVKGVTNEMVIPGILANDAR